MTAARLYNLHKISSIILVSPAEVLVSPAEVPVSPVEVPVSPAEAKMSGRRLEVGVKVEIQKGERIVIEDANILVIYMIHN